ncbi:MAG: phasin family protein [Betaproteobacteria bacterium]|jgi:phasin family protein|nr:phasin family protein [Betaproteobacteria bacterium]
MYNPTEQFAEFNKVNVAQASKLAAIAIGNAEKFVKLGMNTARFAVEQSLENAKAVATVKDVQELFALRAKLAEHGVQTALAYSKNLYELASEAQAELTAASEESWSNYTRGMAKWVDTASQSAPAGSDVAVNAFKSTVAATTAAFDQFQKATRQVVNLADASVRAAANSAAKAAPKGRRAA